MLMELGISVTKLGRVGYYNVILMALVLSVTHYSGTVCVTDGAVSFCECPC